MKKSLTTSALTLIGFTALAMPAIAASEGTIAMDTNGDGVITLDEMTAVFPDVTTENFIDADDNGDGLLDDAEIVAAQEKGLIPTSTDG